jgi:ABC-2 type transport system ATP-binding protein
MLELKNVCKQFGAITAVSDLSLTAKPGEILGLLGPNGAGKTTTLRIIAGFWHPTTGQVLLEGIDLVQKTDWAKRRIGYLPENIALYEDMKVFEYLKFMAEMRDILPEQQLERIKLVAKQCGLNEVIGRTIATLSKGYKQRLGLAQALIHDPALLILDEPTSGLDPNQIAEIRTLIKEIGREKIVIFSTHILAEAAATCDRVIIINQGCKVAEDSPDNLAAGSVGQTYDLQIVGQTTAVETILKNLAVPYEIKDTVYQVVLNDNAQKLALATALAEARLPILEFSASTAGLESSFRQLTTNL